LPNWFEEVFRGAAALLLGHRLSLSDVAALLTILLATVSGALVFAATSD